ncbi:MULTISPECIES: hypothetical protein [Serratia]|uniref:hypothetical protein n=1 Tax=Serratia TaxID=613 RepID=UPI0025753C1C|nr:hypothetical protein [Serratia ureilytica]MDM1842303.1 hypothetical protein [Serratia ureilytica]
MKTEMDKMWGKKDSPEQIHLKTIHAQCKWVEFAASFEGTDNPSPELKSAFHSMWIELGGSIRSCINDDKKLLHVLRTLLPAYGGESLIVYRGENLDRYNQGVIGFCWTQKKDKALQYARGLNACGSGGVLLQGLAPPSAIIATADTHPNSMRLGEYEITVDGSAIKDLQNLGEFPPSH